MPRAKAKPAQAPSETYAARARRGRPSVTVAMSAQSKALLKRLASERGETLGEVVAAGLRALATRWDAYEDEGA